MGAFGSCLGVGRPIDAANNNQRFLKRDVHGLPHLLTVGNLRVNTQINMKLQVPRQLTKQNSYHGQHTNRSLALGFSSAKNRVVQSFLKQSPTVSSPTPTTSLNNSISLQQQALPTSPVPSCTGDILVNIEDTPTTSSSSFNGKSLNNANNNNSNNNGSNASVCSITTSHGQFVATRKDLSHWPNVGEEKILVALFDYEPRTKEDLKMSKGDHLEAMGKHSNDWWLARSKTTKKTGFVPTNFVAELKSLGAEPWYFGKIGRLEAEQRLRSAGNADGAFIIRDADTNQNYTQCYSLSLRHNNQVKHYRIHRLDEGGFYLTKKTVFSTLFDFVEHYSRHADGLFIELKAPCITSLNHIPTIQGLSYDTSDKWEIDRKQLVLLHELGHGQFGQVYEGLWKGPLGKIPVAIKTLRAGSMDPEEFIKEAQIMKKLSHEKLVKLHGVCSEQPIYIVTELMKNGCLLNYLQKNNHLDLRTLIYIGCQIAEGMAYLESKNYLHRDLAARNILVGDENIVKIADFGLARLMKETEYEARPFSKCPIKWTSPESIQFNRYTSKSDVWSFGIVLYEIITHGGTPYHGMTNNEMLQRVERNYRIPMKDMPNCPEKLYKIMLRCWNKDPNRRPTFDTLREELDNFFSTD